ncbi:unnamed protein product [Cochlearia groenlandica]
MASSDLVLVQTHFEALRLGRSDQFVIGLFLGLIKKQIVLGKGTSVIIQFIKDKLCVFKKYGATALDTPIFEALDTPIFELRETLVGKYGEDSKLIYDLANQAGERCSLRYDLTVPFARYVAMKGLPSFKGYQIAKILTELLDELGIGDYELLDGMLEIYGAPPEKFRTICSSIDKLDKQSLERVKKKMVEEKGLSVEIADKIGHYVKSKGAPMELLFQLKQEGSKFLANASSKEVLDEFNIMFEALKRSKRIHKFVFDLSLARGLDYYTCVIFEIVCIGAEVGTIGDSGRYANLIGMFGPRQVLAIGVSLRIERVFNIMDDRNKQHNQAIRPTETQVLVSVMVDNKLNKTSELVNMLREAKINAEYLVSKRREKHFKKARETKIPWMVIIGHRELSQGVVTLKKIVQGSENKFKEFLNTVLLENC